MNNANTEQILVLLSNIEHRQIQQFKMYQQALFEQRDLLSESSKQLIIMSVDMVEQYKVPLHIVSKEHK
jgi:hypothetical protein